MGSAMYIKKIFAPLVVLLVLFSNACFADVSEATFIPQGSETYSPIDESQVNIFSFKPDFAFKVIGSIEARGMATASLLDQLDILGQLKGSTGPGEKDDIRLAIQAMKREAARVGANGVIIVKQGQVRVGPDATERRMVGAAIRY